jgi:hypothetical protein
LTQKYTQEQIDYWKKAIESADQRLLEAAGGMTEKASAFVLKMIEEKYFCKSDGTISFDFATKTMIIPVVAVKKFEVDVIFIENIKGYLGLNAWTIKVEQTV